MARRGDPIGRPVKLGPAMLLCSALFLAGIVAQLWFAYLGAKAEAAEAMEREAPGRRP